MSVSEIAEGFQSAGYNVLLYDSRSVEDSDELPRNQINSQQIVEDVSG